MKTLFSTDEFTELALAWGDAISDGNFKIANRKYKVLQRALITLGKNKEQADEVLKLLQGNPATSVKYWAAIGALEININIDMAENILKEMADDHSTGPIGVIAKISYLEWIKRQNQI